MQSACKRRRKDEVEGPEGGGDAPSLPSNLDAAASTQASRGSTCQRHKSFDPLAADVWDFERLKVRRSLCVDPLAKEQVWCFGNRTIAPAWVLATLVRAQAYVSYVKETFQPVMSPEAQKALSKFVCSLRKMHGSEGACVSRLVYLLYLHCFMALTDSPASAPVSRTP